LTGLRTTDISRPAQQLASEEGQLSQLGKPLTQACTDGREVLDGSDLPLEPQ